MSARGAFLAFAHIGDLHLERRNQRNAVDLRAALAEVSDLHRNGLIDFAYLPGDLAEDGKAEQYAILERALGLSGNQDLPVRLIVGDHDRQYGTLKDFDAFFARVAGSARGGGHAARTNDLPRPRHRKPVRQYYYAETIAGVRCLFLDMVSAGYGEAGFGLDFRLGPCQLRWLGNELAAAAGRPCAVFTHTYPADLRVIEEGIALAGLIRGHGVRLVEMGHTHYNELAHDGRTLYAAARSVGQNEDGSVGYAVAAIDGPVTSWRFKPLDRALPFVMITSPADRRLATAALPQGAIDGMIDVRALVLSRASPSAWCCQLRVDDGPPQPMTLDGPRTVHARIAWPEDARRLSVTVTDGTVNTAKQALATDTDVIEPVARSFVPPPAPKRPGSDAFRLKAWPEKGIRGDQLGPNRNGRHW